MTFIINLPKLAIIEYNFLDRFGNIERAKMHGMVSKINGNTVGMPSWRHLIITKIVSSNCNTLLSVASGKVLWFIDNRKLDQKDKEKVTPEEGRYPRLILHYMPVTIVVPVTK